MAGMSCHGIAVVQMRVLGQIDLNGTAVIHPKCHTAFADALHGPKLAVCQLQFG